MSKILHFERMGVRGAAVCVALAAGAMLSSSCVRRELYVKPDEGQVILNYDWRNLPSGETAPGQMTVYLYGADGSLTRGLTENGTFSATLPSGQYKVLTLNQDLPGVGFTNMEDFDRAYAYALPFNKKAEGDDMWIGQPEGWLYSAHATELTVLKEDTIQQTMVPDPLVQHVTLNLRFTGDYNAVADVSAALTGVAPSVRLVTGKCEDGYASVIEFEPKPTVEEGKYTADVLVFGLVARNPDGSAADNRLRLNVTFNNGGSQFIEENVEVGGEAGPTDIEIKIDVDIEVASTSEAGFTATVTRWETTTGDMNVDNRPGGIPLAGPLAE